MLDRYEPHFTSLTDEQAEYLSRAMSRAYRMDPPRTGPDLHTYCKAHGIDHATVVMSLAHDCTPTGVTTIETLVGKPIVRTPPPTPKRARARGAARPRADGRYITAVEPNPKRPGTKSYDRFAKYQVGLSVDETLALPGGPNRDDIRYDSSRGFITLGDKP